MRADNQRSPGARDAKTPDALRLQLVRVWEKVLGNPRIDTTQDFFALGGDSLAAATMLAAIEKYFGVHLPVSALLEGGSIDKLAALIREGGWSEAKLRLVALRLLGTKPALYCVPGAGSDALSFRELARRLGDDQPVFAFQPKGLDGSTPFLRTIEKIAAAHIAALREHQPSGPYYLCGSSLGGVVAFEMARRLSESGEEVRFLGLLDSYGGDYPKLRRDLSLAQKLKLALQGLLPVAERDKITLRNLRKRNCGLVPARPREFGFAFRFPASANTVPPPIHLLAGSFVRGASPVSIATLFETHRSVPNRTPAVKRIVSAGAQFGLDRNG